MLSTNEAHVALSKDRSQELEKEMVTIKVTREVIKQLDELKDFPDRTYNKVIEDLIHWEKYPLTLEEIADIKEHENFIGPHKLYTQEEFLTEINSK